MTAAIWHQLRDSLLRRDFSAAEKFLVDNPSLVALRNGIGETVLHYMAVENDQEAVAWLHARGFSLNETNAFDIPVVFEVAQLGYKELLLWFVDNGGDLSAKDGDGNDILAHLLQYEEVEMARFVENARPKR